MAYIRIFISNKKRKFPKVNTGVVTVCRIYNSNNYCVKDSYSLKYWFLFLLKQMITNMDSNNGSAISNTAFQEALQRARQVFIEFKQHSICL